MQYNQVMCANSLQILKEIGSSSIRCLGDTIFEPKGKRTGGVSNSETNYFVGTDHQACDR